MTAKKSVPVLFRAEAATADLLRAMSKICGVVEKRNTVPILSFVELAVGFGTIAIRGTDLEMEARVEIEGSGESAACLPAYLLRVVSHVDRVEMSADEDGVVTVTAGEISFTMNTLPVADFPGFSIGPKAWGTNLAEGVTDFLIGGVTHAISTEETHYYLNGICLEVKDGALLAVATDGHRLAKRESNLTGKNPDQPNAILPRKASLLALGFAGKGEASLAMHKGKEGDRIAYCEIISGGVRLRSKLIDGTYPDWRRVVPAPSNMVLEVETKLLRRALKATAINSEGRYHMRATKITVKGDAIIVSSRSPDLGEARANLPCQIAGNVPEFGFNGRYLDDMATTMERIGSKTMRLHVTDPESPIRIGPQEAIAGTVNILMPMRI